MSIDQASSIWRGLMAVRVSAPTFGREDDHDDGDYFTRDRPRVSWPTAVVMLTSLPFRSFFSTPLVIVRGRVRKVFESIADVVPAACHAWEDPLLDLIVLQHDAAPLLGPLSVF